MPSESEIRDLARRAAARALAERGNARAEAGHPLSPARTAGVHVAVEGSATTSRPLERQDPARPRPGGELVSAATVAGLAPGGVLRVPPGAIVTDLAREEARARGIRLERGELARAPIAPAGRVVAVAADHGGFAAKARVIGWVRELGAVALDLGTNDENPVDYPDIARAVGEAVARGRAELGICLDGAGIGSAIAANKVRGVRAATCWDAASARNAREHNHANVLSLGAKMLAASALQDAVRAFLATAPGGERHARRVEKISAIERDAARSTEAGR